MSDISLSRKHNAAHITLNRPQALNAMTIEMVTTMAKALREWADDDTIHHVLITSSAERAFCAGGDVREAVSVIDANPDIGAEPYFAAEYGFDMCLATFPKPVTSLVSGVVMGGGLGVARLSDRMVISSDIKLAMPETAIGLFPDVGASYFLRRAPLGAALMMGMTGQMFGAGDAMAWHIADAHIPQAEFEALFEALSQCKTQSDIDATITQFETKPPAPHFANHDDEITDIFCQETLTAIIEAARTLPDDHILAPCHDALLHKCPTSIAAIWYMMTKSDVPETSYQAILRDFFLARKMTARPDFREGVRAVLVDKDNTPLWQPASLDDITMPMMQDLFDFEGMSPLPERGFIPKS